MDKYSLSERDICTKFITPALERSGWDRDLQIREEFSLTAGRVIVRGKLHTRGKVKRADYVLFYKPNIPIAVIEAKDAKHSLGDGMQQALGYADLLKVPFVFSSNGSGFLFHNRVAHGGPTELEISIDEFPSAETLWKLWSAFLGRSAEQNTIVAEDYHVDTTDRAPRYYQFTAINEAVAAIARGQDRLLLVMATGTGKTYTAFQIIWRLWKSESKKRILYLADRNVLIDQTMTNDFKPFGAAMTKIRNRNADKSYEIYLALYQAVSGREEDKNTYKQFSRDFFDLVVVDECHRGSAAEDSAWREILEYFSSATHIGMTATPKESDSVSNVDYFGVPIYTYSLRQGIEDGFLAPYKVVRIDLDKDVLGWRPDRGMRDSNGLEIEDRVYGQKDFDRSLVLDKRTQLVADKITEFLKATNRFDKTIVFCANIDHAERMRQALVNANPDLVAENHRYVMRITGDNEEGKLELDNFIFPESRYPVIATTSKLMTTGVDAQTCKLIVIDQRILSMTEFKQTIGRGTRINAEYDKFFFTIMDFRRATELFADPAFDGEPVQIYEPGPNDSPLPPEEDEMAIPGTDVDARLPITDMILDKYGDVPAFVARYVVNNVEVTVSAERVQYFDSHGRLTTESLRDYTRRSISSRYNSLSDFQSKWSVASNRQALLDELSEEGVFFEALAHEFGDEYDPYDLICFLAWGQPIQTRSERSDRANSLNLFATYSADAQRVLRALLDKYTDEGVAPLQEPGILTLVPFPQMGTPVEIIRSFGGIDRYRNAVSLLQQSLYSA